MTDQQGGGPGHNNQRLLKLQTGGSPSAGAGRPKAPVTHPLKRLAQYCAVDRAQLWRAHGFCVLNTFFDVLPEVLIGVAVDLVVNREDSFLARFGVADPFQQVLVLGALTLLIWVGESLSEYLYSLGYRNLAQRIQHRIRMDTYRHVQSLDLSWFERASSGQVLAVLNDDVNQLERFFNTGIAELIQVFTTVFLVGVVFFALSPSIALVSFCPVPLILFGTFYFQRRIAPHYHAVRSHAGLLSGRLYNNIQGMMTIQSFCAEDAEAERLGAESAGYVRANADAIRWSSAFVPVIRMGVLAGFLATLVYGGHLALQGALAVGSYSVLIFLTQRMLWPLTRLSQTADNFQRSLASVSRIFTLLDAPVSIRAGEGTPLDQRDIKGLIQFENVSFAYPHFPDRPVLRQFSLSVEPGRTVGIVGATGAGKSTLLKLILRFYDTHEGTVALDGHPVQSLDLRSLRQAVGFVSQDVFLIDGTVAENIAYGTPGSSAEAIEDAACEAEAHAFITALPQGYQTPIGERGQKLSGGQRQRLALARVILKNAPVLLLDEATSAVDNETEAAIQRSLRKFCQGRTTIIVAHRLSTVRHAECIYVLDGGAVAESGRHDELVQADGLYKRLWEVQTGM